MHVVEPTEASTCMSKSAKGECGLRRFTITLLRVTASRDIFTDEGGGRLGVEARIKQSFLWSRERERKGDTGME